MLDRECPSSVWRPLLDDDEFTDGLWDRVVELGWTGLLVPEEAGGLGLGLVDLVVVLEEMGSDAVPGALPSRPPGARHARGPGTRPGGPAGFAGQRDHPRHGRRRRGRPWPGRRPHPHAGEPQERPLVAPRHQGGRPRRAHGRLGARARPYPGGATPTFLLEDPACEPVPALDPSRKIARLEGLERHAGHTRRARRRPRRRCGVGSPTTAPWPCCAEARRGRWSRRTAFAVEYAKQQRRRSARSIATFQVIRHKAVDMLHRL
ncbi:MAG: acyl-CoA dehydrogenase family protein [Acidimicrobiia bacterium]|nr:acyl-CoA dehydrogenase family protein [Acidimicrobiia bacterium]